MGYILKHTNYQFNIRHSQIKYVKKLILVRPNNYRKLLKHALNAENSKTLCDLIKLYLLFEDFSALDR